MNRLYSLFLLSLLLTPISILAADSQPELISKVEAKFPSKAARDGIEGWVKLSFEINEIGGVENVKVIGASPKRIFDREARKALRKWKYVPKVINGKPARQTGLVTQIDFKLNEEQKKALETKKNIARAQDEAKVREREYAVQAIRNSGIGTLVCRDERLYVTVGYVEAFANDKIKVSVHKRLGYNNTIVTVEGLSNVLWDDITNFYRCKFN